MIQAILGSSFFRAVIWPIIKQEVIDFVQKYVLDPAFRKAIDDAATATIQAQTPEEKANASKALQQAMSRR